MLILSLLTEWDRGICNRGRERRVGVWRERKPGRNIWRRKLLCKELLPINVFKPLVAEDFIHTVSTEPCFTVLIKKLYNQVLSIRGDCDFVAHWVREIHWSFPDEEVHSVLVAVEERRNTNNHLVNEDTKCPPVHCIVMTIANEHFWG